MTAIITTIQPPTPAVRALTDRLVDLGWPLVVIGDAKGPSSYELDGVRFFDLDAQRATGFATAEALPTGHYCRKNVGYLVAIRDGAETIFETDDDNAPNDAWTPRDLRTEAVTAPSVDWLNVYASFSEERIWPRGFPLDRITDPTTRFAPSAGDAVTVEAPIQQGLADLSPDVDAIWRLVDDRPFRFDDAPSIHLPPGTWCPFNSQSTWWWPQAYPLLYLPSFCSFRMTDIWRSFVAQRILAEWDLGIVFHAPEVEQERNPHDLMRDFADEVPGYLGNTAIRQLLETLELDGARDAVGDDLQRCYHALIDAGHIGEEERSILAAWVSDLTALTSDAPKTTGI